MISRSISTSRKLSKVDDTTALIFTWIQPHTDEYGRMDGDARMIKATVVPLRDYSEEKVEEVLKTLEKMDLIKRYTVDEEIYLEVINFDLHQTFRADRAKKAECPPPDSHTAPTVSHTGETKRVSKVKLSKVKSSKTTKKRKSVFVTVTEGNLINDVIDLFKEVNPSFERLFAQTSQRKAVDRLCVKYGTEKVKNMVCALAEINGKKYAPTITTPIVLENKLGDLIAFVRKQKDSGKGKKIAGL